MSPFSRKESAPTRCTSSSAARRRPSARPRLDGSALDYFGELALVDGAPRSATVVATQELYVMALPAQSVLRLARRQPSVTLAMLRDLSTQLRRLEAQVARST